MSKYRRHFNMDTDWESLLDQSYHHLCRSVRPESFYTWLRTKNVLTLDEQEEVEHKYITTVMKTGHLIDTIRRKGLNGFKAFMEVVEYVYPDTYNIITGKQARNPPNEFSPATSVGNSAVERRGPALSAEILGEMGNLVNVLSQANIHKKEELVKLQSYVAKLQKENETMCEENRAVLQKFKDSQVEIEELKQKLDDLSEKHESETKTRKSLLEECEKLRTVRDQLLEKTVRQDREELSLTENEIQRSHTCRMPGTKPTREETDSRLRVWQTRYTQLEEKYDGLIKDLEDIRVERNQMDEQSKRTQALYDKETETNKRLAADCDKYNEKFYKMEAQLTSLYNEIDHLRMQQSQGDTDNASGVPKRNNNPSSLLGMLQPNISSPVLLAPETVNNSLLGTTRTNPKAPKPNNPRSPPRERRRMGPDHQVNAFSRQAMLTGTSSN